MRRTPAQLLLLLVVVLSAGLVWWMTSGTEASQPGSPAADEAAESEEGGEAAIDDGAAKLAQGKTLSDALGSSIDDLDGTFSFLVSTKDEIGYDPIDNAEDYA